MARASKVELCMLCGELPCVCGKKSKTIKASKPKPVPKVTEPAPVRRSMRDAMKATALAKPVVKPEPKPVIHRVIHKPETPIEDLLFADSVRNLAPLLHPDEITKYQVLISSTPSVLERAAIWRARRQS